MSKRSLLTNFWFTLVELLVVIAIMSVLAAMLMGTLQGARSRAKQAYCLNNLKQTILGALTYADDYSYRMVPAVAEWWYCYWTSLDEFRQSIGYGILSPYHWWYQIWVAPVGRLCPAATAEPRGAGINNYRDAIQHFRIPCLGYPFASYAYNINLFNEGNGWVIAKNIHGDWINPWYLPQGQEYLQFSSYQLNRLPRPDVSVAWVDVDEPWVGVTHCDASYGWFGDNATGLVSYRHQQGANAAFFDGHAERVARHNLDRSMEPTLRHWKILDD